MEKIVRVNLDWLTFSITNLRPEQMLIFDDISERFNLKIEDYKVRGHLFASSDDMNVQAQNDAGYIIIELKPKYFWSYLPEIKFDENFYINHIKNLLLECGYKISERQIKFNRVDIAIDYLDSFQNFDDTFLGIRRSRKFSIDSIRNVGNSLNGRSSYLNGNNNKWQIVRYEKSKELLNNPKPYYHKIYTEKNVNRLEIRLNKEYIKQYDNNRKKFFPLFKKLLGYIDDVELNELKIFDNFEDIKSIKNDIKGVYMNLRQKLINELQEKLTLLVALENTYNGRDFKIDEIFDNLKSEIVALPKLSEKQRYYRRYLKQVK